MGDGYMLGGDEGRYLMGWGVGEGGDERMVRIPFHCFLLLETKGGRCLGP